MYFACQKQEFTERERTQELLSVRAEFFYVNFDLWTSVLWAGNKTEGNCWIIKFSSVSFVCHVQQWTSSQNSFIRIYKFWLENVKLWNSKCILMSKNVAMVAWKNALRWHEETLRGTRITLPRIHCALFVYTWAIAVKLPQIHPSTYDVGFFWGFFFWGFFPHTHVICGSFVRFFFFPVHLFSKADSGSLQLNSKRKADWFGQVEGIFKYNYFYLIFSISSYNLCPRALEVAALWRVVSCGISMALKMVMCCMVKRLLGNSHRASSCCVHIVAWHTLKQNKNKCSY